MAATTLQLAPTNDTDANFRLWGKAISDILLAGGMVKTADTGQIDWATVTKPAVGIFAGYEMWRSDDATIGNGLSNFYLKIEYGSAGGNLFPRMRVTAGWATNGAGSLVGIVTEALDGGSPGSPSTTLYTSNLSAGKDFAIIVMFNVIATFANIFSIERTRLLNGTPTDEIILMHSGANTSTRQWHIQVCNKNTGVFVRTNNNPFLSMDTTQLVQGGKAGVMQCFGQKGIVTSPSLNVLGSTIAASGSIQSIVNVEMYGVERPYIVNQNPSFMNVASTVCLTRYQ